MSRHHGPKVVMDSMTMYIDAANPKSYPGTGTTIYDMSGNGNTSTMNSVTHSDNALIFDGTGERDGSPLGAYITLPDNVTTTAPETKTNGVTYQWWMKIDGHQAQGHGLFVGSGTINHIEYRGSSTTGNFRTEAVRQNGYSFGTSSVSLDKDYWHNIAVVFANSETDRPVRWYKNGELFHTGDMTSGQNPTNEYFKPNKFGSSTGHPSYLYVQSFYGRASVLSFYDKALTANEIKQNFNALRGRYGI
jgi:hypothetical protein